MEELGTRRRNVVYYLLFPAIIMELLVYVFPSLLSGLISLKQVTQYTIADWIHAPFLWFKNYGILFDFDNPISKAFFSSVATTLKYGLTAKILHFGLGLWAALIVNRAFKGRGFFRTLFMIPYAIPIFISAIAWRFMFLKDWGFINYILVDKLHWLADKPFWLVGANSFWAMVTTQVWRGWSFHYIMILAALQTVPEEIFEAIEIDGGGDFVKFRHGILPFIKPVLITLLVVNGAAILNEFQTAFILLGDSPAQEANVISIHSYTQAFDYWNFGISSAMSITWLIIIVMISFGFKRITGKKAEG